MGSKEESRIRRTAREKTPRNKSRSSFETLFKPLPRLKATGKTELALTFTALRPPKEDFLERTTTLLDRE